MTRVYCMKDLKIGVFLGLSLGMTDASVKRAIVESLANAPSTVRSYPEDFDLYCVGEFNDESGELVSRLEFICNVASLLRKEG